VLDLLQLAGEAPGGEAEEDGGRHALVRRHVLALAFRARLLHHADRFRLRLAKGARPLRAGRGEDLRPVCLGLGGDALRLRVLARLAPRVLALLGDELLLAPRQLDLVLPRRRSMLKSIWRASVSGLSTR
jgi:hypothetical protein